jgi:hypothetical protein
MDDAREHLTVIDPRHTTLIPRQERLDPHLLLIRNLKKSAIRLEPKACKAQSQPDAAVNPVYGA